MVNKTFEPPDSPMPEAFSIFTNTFHFCLISLLNVLKAF